MSLTATLTNPLEAVANAAPPAALGAPFGDSVVVFAVSLLVGGLAIHVAATHFVAAGDYSDALLTALLGAIAWSVLDIVPLVGPLLALVAWVGVIKWRYPAGWIRAIFVGVTAWAVATVVLAALALIGIGSFEALGVPGA